MTYRKAKQAILDEVSRLQTEHHASALRLYSRSGGGYVFKSWRTAGFFLEEGTEQRLVCEAICFSNSRECVVRVYREDPLDIMFARKMTVETHMGQTLRDASKIFIENSRASLLSHEGPNAETLSGLPWPFRTIFYNALLPIPPPIDLAQIEFAEQSAAASPSVDRQKVDGQ